MSAAQTTIPVLRFGSDVPTRLHYFVREAMSHPCKLHLGLLQFIIDRYTCPGDTIIDPMGGSGSLLLAATQQRHVIVRDVEPRYLALMHDSAAHILRECGLFVGRIDVGQADARQPWGVTVDHIITSPPYGNAASPHAGTRKCLPYRLAALTTGPTGDRWRSLERQAGAMGSLSFHYGEHPAQIGHLRSARYWEAMTAIYRQAHAALSSHGYMVLVLKNHVRDGRIVPVADDTVALCAGLGFVLVERHARVVWPMSLWMRRRKERGDLVVEHEDVLAFRRRG